MGSKIDTGNMSVIRARKGSRTMEMEEETIRLLMEAFSAIKLHWTETGGGKFENPDKSKIIRMTLFPELIPF